MSRQAFVDKLPEDQKKALEEIRKHNSEALKTNEVIKNLNADLKTVTQDIKDADAARAAKQKDVETAKFAEIETLMQKDTAAPAQRADSVGLPGSGTGGPEEI